MVGGRVGKWPSLWLVPLIINLNSHVSKFLFWVGNRVNTCETSIGAHIEVYGSTSTLLGYFKGANGAKVALTRCLWVLPHNVVVWISRHCGIHPLPPTACCKLLDWKLDSISWVLVEGQRGPDLGNCLFPALTFIAKKKKTGGYLLCNSLGILQMNGYYFAHFTRLEYVSQN